MTASIIERLSTAHGRDLSAAIEGGYDSDPIFIDAKTEIDRLRAELQRVRCNCGYVAALQTDQPYQGHASGCAGNNVNFA